MKMKEIGLRRVCLLHPLRSDIAFCLSNNKICDLHGTVSVFTIVPNDEVMSSFHYDFLSIEYNSMNLGGPSLGKMTMNSTSNCGVSPQYPHNLDSPLIFYIR